MSIPGKSGQTRPPRAGSISSVIRNDEVNLLLMIQGGDLIIIAYHLTVSMKKENPGPFVMALVKAGNNRNVVLDGGRKVESIASARGDVLTGIKNEV
jgi:hypothetical protein